MSSTGWRPIWWDIGTTSTTSSSTYYVTNYGFTPYYACGVSAPSQNEIDEREAVKAQEKAFKKAPPIEELFGMKW